MQSKPLIALFTAALWLAGCNMPSPVASAPPPPPPAGPVEPAIFAKLPEVAACTGKIHRFQALLRADLASGNLERPVYDQIELELSQAAADCVDGLGAQAMTLLKATAARHGYHV